MLCSVCKKRIATVFVAKNPNSPTAQGICLVCARNMGIKPVDDIMEKMGFSKNDVDEMIDQLENFIPSQIINNKNNIPEEEIPQQDFDNSTSFLPQILPINDNNDNEEKKDPNKKTYRNFKDKRKFKRSKKKYLETYCQSLNEKAKNLELDIVVKREKELERVIQILCRRTKNNPCLIGEPGVGKTAIAECLATRISQGRIHAKMRRKEIYLVDLTALISGTQFRGQFENRIKGLIEEVESLKNIILVIDEIHNIIGSSDSEGSGSPMNAANILKPALSRGRVQIIGATTFKEYRKYIEKDSALERRFQPVIIKEPSLNDTHEILCNIKYYYEKFHNVIVPKEILIDIVKLSERYVIDRFLPDKAIDLLDESCALTSLKDKRSSDIQDLDLQLNSLQKEKKEIAEDASNDNSELHYKELAKINYEIARLEEEKNNLTKDFKSLPIVTKKNIAKVIELWTGIKSAKVEQNELSKFINLEKRLNEKIVGQKHSIKCIVASILRNRVKINPRNRPSSFIFVGPTGIGKTELVKVLSTELFDFPDSLIRFDMSEFMEKHSVSRVVGSPPGYVGYDEAGQLTEKVRRQPYSVLLLDEIEKAHPDVMNILLQILDEGRVTDSHGRTVNFENTIIIMTSNAGSEKRSGVIGFGKSQYQINKERAMKALSDFLNPEFLGRVDEIIVFNDLSLENFKSIAQIILSEYVKSLLERGVSFKFDKESIDYLSMKSYGKKSGARALRNLIRKEVEDKIANALIETEETLKAISLSFIKNSLCLSYK
ncbi:MAG: ATP-dependent Clp protease ATP-binding subunit [Oscillospiraceae bacterium]|jgi:ATP-dependent Clp protease ATP-binding subunit ClpA|nr:ATP-dependent Clp protease ATP-binding subunit [Oscillospiraceae bacterium]